MNRGGGGGNPLDPMGSSKAAGYVHPAQQQPAAPPQRPPPPQQQTQAHPQPHAQPSGPSFIERHSHILFVIHSLVLGFLILLALRLLVLRVVSRIKAIWNGLFNRQVQYVQQQQPQPPPGYKYE